MLKLKHIFPNIQISTSVPSNPYDKRTARSCLGKKKQKLLHVFQNGNSVSTNIENKKTTQSVQTLKKKRQLS